MIIPKIIHQVWDGSTQVLPESFVSMAETWKAMLFCRRTQGACRGFSI